MVLWCWNEWNIWQKRSRRLTPWRNWLLYTWSRNCPIFSACGLSLPLSQESTICVASQTNSVLAIALYLSKVILSMIPCTPISTMWFLPFRFPNQKPVHISFLCHTCYMPCPSLPLFDHPSRYLMMSLYRWISSYAVVSSLLLFFPPRHMFVP